MSRNIKSIISSLSLGEHMGDVNDVLPELCEALGLPKPSWCDNYSSFVMAWDRKDHDEEFDKWEEGTEPHTHWDEES